MTITEALAEIKTIGKRLDSKRNFIIQYLFRQEMLKDPLAGDGGSQEVLRRERQAMTDLEARVVALRLAIAKANDAATVTIGTETRSIASWLAWKRDVAPNRKNFLASMRQKIDGLRSEAARNGLAVITQSVAQSSVDIVVNIDERALAQEIEAMEETLGNLDGQLSLKNATVQVEI